jgi:hypothetical protein
LLCERSWDMNGRSILCTLQSMLDQSCCAPSHSQVCAVSENQIWYVAIVHFAFASFRSVNTILWITLPEISESDCFKSQRALLFIDRAHRVWWRMVESCLLASASPNPAKQAINPDLAEETPATWMGVPSQSFPRTTSLCHTTVRA